MTTAIVCPKCGGPIRWQRDCPGTPVTRVGYGPTRQPRADAVVCSPPCGDATRFACLSPRCGWWYRYPVGMRRDVADMGEAPDWLAGLVTGDGRSQRLSPEGDSL